VIIKIKLLKINHMKTNLKPASADSRAKQKSATKKSQHSLIPKTNKMGKQVNKSDQVATENLAQSVTTKLNPFSQTVDGILKLIKELPDEPLLLDGYDEFILGYEEDTSSIIYDALGIIDKIIDEEMAWAKNNGEELEEWEDCYDRAYAWVFGGLVKSVGQWQFKNGKMIDLTAGRPFPKMLVRF